MTGGRWAAVLFDLDDTLIDYSSAAAVERQRVTELVLPHVPEGALPEFQARFRDHLARHHVEVDTGRVPVAEYRERRLRHALRPWRAPSPELCAAVARCADATAAEVRLVEGVTEALRSLRAAGVRIGIVTNGPATIQSGKCARLGLAEAVDTVVTSQDVRRTKPDRAAFHEALRRLGVPPGRSVVVGDSWENDVLGGLRAGLGRAVHIGCPHSCRLTAPGLLGRLPRVDHGLLALLEVPHAER
ncbi:HAD family hydrolase [Streptomyces sp. NPDC059785]|uniref:HAD family hydrolase n=1 Tax=unclassified Streptomyces TaxID=2593676 RepID=UPI003661B132